MLKLLRQKQRLVRGFLGFIVFILAAGMLIYLVPGLGGGGTTLTDPQGVLARVGDDTVTQAEAQRNFQRQADLLGTQSAVFRDLIMERVVQGLIEERAVTYEAKRLGLEVPPEEVAARLRELPYLYPNGKFVGAEAYRQIVQSNFHVSVPEFEEQLRRQSLQSKLFSWVTGGLTVTPAEIEEEYRRRNERVELEYVVLAANDFAARVSPSESDLRASFERTKDRYPMPERRGVRAVQIAYQAMIQRVQVSPQELDTFYRSHLDTYHVPEQAHVRQILFLRQPPGAVSPRDPAELRKKAEDVLAQIRRGKDFAALAKQYSDDATSKEQGGEIGWVRRGQTVGELEQALFSQPVGTAQLVETNYGVHVLQVLDRTAERVKPLAEVQGEIEPQLRAQKARDAALVEARRIVDAARAGQSLDAVARQAGWPVLEPPPFAREEAGAGAAGVSQDYQDWAYRLPAESAGQPTAPASDPISTPFGYLIVQLKQVFPAHPASFEEARAKVEQAFRRERAVELAGETAEKLAAEAQKTGQLRGPAQKLGLTVQTSQPLTRDGSIPGVGSVRDIAATAFSLPVGGVSPALLVGGNRIVFRLTKHELADPAQLTPDQRKTLRTTLLDQKRGLAWAVFTQSLQKRLKADGILKVNDAAVARLTNKSKPGSRT